MINRILLILLFVHTGLIMTSAQQKVASSDKPLINEESVFRFAIMGDRTGGMRPGIFANAAEKANLMQPEFVLSVGDLIDGYTTEPEVWNRQWEEFDAIINTLDMRFYYVPGNHDISNDLLKEAWKQRHGDPYYTFVYKDVLFVALHTEDRKGGGLGEKQIEVIRKQIQKNDDVRWTLVFMHRPIWSYGNQAGYEEIEDALNGRNYSVFSGHHHHYEYQKRNGMDHYVLATSGGGSYLRGVEFGEFDHITWVTMKNDGPNVAHIEFDHIHDKNIVTEANKTQVQALRLGRWFQPEPVYFGEDKSTATFDISLTNPTSDTLFINGKLPDSLISFQPANLSISLPPDTDSLITVQVKKDDKISVHELNESRVLIKLEGSYKTGKKPLSLPTEKRIVFEKAHQLTAKKQKVTIDGKLDEWEETTFTTVTEPVYMHEDWDWKGAQDGRFRFAIQQKGENIVVAAQAFDERVITSENIEDRQDKFFLRFDPAPSETPKIYPDRLFGFEPVSAELHYQIDIAAGENISSPLISSNTELKNVTTAMRVDSATGIISLEAEFPKSFFTNKNRKEGDLFRFNIGWMDHDRPENTKPSVLWWRPVWGSGADRVYLGRFSLVGF